MTEQPMPFDHEPDPALGDALRHALASADHAMFVARVVAAVPAARSGSWDVLAAWAGRGMAVAAVALVVGFALGRTFKPGPSFDEAIVTSSDSGAAATALVTGSHPPDASIILARP